ncbi:MAG: hypothetical protein M9962_07615 [Oligoflexia bacterium]|nr:hypothetical protein [Oligoflexia bacterium]
MEKLLFLVFIALCSCTANQTEDSRADRAMALLNQRKYSEAKHTLEEALAKDPTNKTKAYLLSMAYVGEVDAELFSLLQKVVSEQNTPPPEVLAKLDCGKEEWDSLKDKSIACMMSRILRQIPEHEVENIEKAKKLLREYYPDPKTTNHDKNFFIAYLELYKILNRARILTSQEMYERVKKIETIRSEKELIPGQKEFEEVNALIKIPIHHLKNMSDEFMHMFRRLKYSYTKIATYTKNIDGKPILEVEGKKLYFDENTDVSSFVHFGIEVLSSQGEKVDRNSNRNLQGVLEKIAPRLLYQLDQLGYITRNSKTLDKVFLSFKFQKFILDFLKEAVTVKEGRQVSSDVDDLRLVWLKDGLKSNPPGIFGDLKKSIISTWNQEDITPIFDFHRRTKDEWNTLGIILKRWDSLGREDDFSELEEAFRVFVRNDTKTIFRHNRDSSENFLLLTPKEFIATVLLDAEYFLENYAKGSYTKKVPDEKKVKIIQFEFLEIKKWLEKNIINYRADSFS